MSTLAATPVIPIDPQDLDATRPTDIDTCGTCFGDGAIQVPTGHLYAAEYDSHECWACGGTGSRVQVTKVCHPCGRRITATPDTVLTELDQHYRQAHPGYAEAAAAEAVRMVLP